MTAVPVSYAVFGTVPVDDQSQGSSQRLGGSAEPGVVCSKGGAPVRHSILSVLSLVTACGGSEHVDASAAVRDSAGISIVEHELGVGVASCRIDSVPMLTIGTASGEPEYELHRVFGSTRLSDGRIVLVNQGTQELRYYDADGRFLQRAGRSGQGPGEFSNAFLIWPMPGDTVWVGNYDPWEFHVFGPDGKWARTVNPMPQYLNSPDVIAVLADGRMVLSKGPWIGDGDGSFGVRNLTLVVHGPDGALRDSLGTYENGRWGQVAPASARMWTYPLFESFVHATARGTRVVIGHGGNPSLSVFEGSDTLRLTTVMRWTAGDRSVEQGDIDAERARTGEQYADMDESRRERLLEPLISGDRPVADQFPAFSGVEIGRDGRIWVREFRRPTGDQTQGWMVFDANGGFVCRATTPTLDEIHEFGADYVLGLERDELGVEQVVMFRIRP